MLSPNRNSAWVAPFAHVGQGDATADANGRRRRPQDDVGLLADLAANEAKHALGGAERERARLGVGVVDELVEHDIGVGSDGEGGLVDKQHL